MLASDLGDFRLVVERLEGWVRYRVLRRSHRTDPGGPVLLASGTQNDVRAAMDAAERVARRSGAGGRRPAGERAA